MTLIWCCKSCKWALWADICPVAEGGEIDGSVGAFGKLSEDGDGSIAERIGCGACIGDWGGINVDPDGEAI